LIPCFLREWLWEKNRKDDHLQVLHLLLSSLQEVLLIVLHLDWKIPTLSTSSRECLLDFLLLFTLSVPVVATFSQNEFHIVSFLLYFFHNASHSKSRQESQVSSCESCIQTTGTRNVQQQTQEFSKQIARNEVILISEHPYS
jgi:hypothetical protein